MESHLEMYRQGEDQGGVIQAGDRETITTRRAPGGISDAVIVRLERQTAKRAQ